MKHPTRPVEAATSTAGGRELPEIGLDAFAEAASAYEVAAAVAARLHCHYRELRRWNRRLSLVGPGTATEVLDRHYLEALQALPEIPITASGALVDVGSGGGFPGLVLAACRPGLRVYLVESRARKAAFLRHAVASCGLDAEVIEGRIGKKLPPQLPKAVDFLTLRGVRLELASWRTLIALLGPSSRVMSWAGAVRQELPSELRLCGSVPIVGSDRRLIEIFSLESTA